MMKRKDFKFIFAPIGVAFGIALFVSVCIFVSRLLGITKLSEIIHFIPGSIFIIIGIIILIFFLPIFILGIYYLNRRGAVGQSETLRTNGIYKYTRNPMYIGISMTIIGIGLILLNTGVIIGGLMWFFITYIQCKREEPDLKKRFGKGYEAYKKNTPVFIPNIRMLMSDIFKKLNINK
jgi:protein-S-isoprenylcysteine O-methyltransferase Ste14